MNNKKRKKLTKQQSKQLALARGRKYYRTHRKQVIEANRLRRLKKSVVVKPVIAVRRPKRKPYLNNRDLLDETIASKKVGKMSDKLAKMLMMLTERYASKGKFQGYSWVEDMIGFAMMQLVISWKGFNEQKFTNAFAFYTQCVHNSFIQYINKEHRVRDVKDVWAVENGIPPSDHYNQLYRQQLEAQFGQSNLTTQNGE